VSRKGVVRLADAAGPWQRAGHGNLTTAAELLRNRAAALFDAGKPRVADTSMAKYHPTESP